MPLIDKDQISIKSEKVPENKETSADVQPEKATDKMATVEVMTKERGHQEELPKALTHDMDDRPKSVHEKSVRVEKIYEEADVLSLQLNMPTGQVEEEYISVRIAKEPRIVQVQSSVQCEKVQENKVRTVADVHPEKTTVEMTTLEEQVHKVDKISPASLQAVQKPDIILEVPEGSAMRNIFTETELLAGSGPNSQLIEDKPLEDAPEVLITPTSDLDNLLGRLVSKVLSCKNYPTELNPTAMAQQLAGVQECQKIAEAQVSFLSQLRGADTENKDALEHVEDQWSTAVQDAATVIQNKEAQLQVVTDYCNQMQAAKTTLERLTGEHNAVRTSPEESCSKELERLCSLQRSMDENRTVLGELLVTHTKLCPHLSRSERASARAEQKNLQERWRGLERALDRTLYHTNAHSNETSSLWSMISGLQEHLETIGKDLQAKSPSVSQWDCKNAQQLMVANAEIKAAQQKCLYLEQLSEALLLSSRWEKETKEIQHGLQRVKDQLSRTEELVSSQTQSSSNPIMEKMIVVMRDGLAWAKQTESDIEGRRRRVALLPEEVHWQLRDLKKLQSEVMAKQGQLEVLVEEVTELIPQLDQAEEVPVVRSSLESLEKLSKSTSEKLANAVREIESGLQTREKLSEQIADLDSWVVAHLHREASRSPDNELRSPTEFDRRVRQIQETLAEAEKQAAEDIRAISSYEKMLVDVTRQSKMASLEMKAQDHEKYLNMRQCVEDLKENVQEQVLQTKEGSRDQEEKYEVYQTLLLRAEQHRLKQNMDSLDTAEITLYNDLSIIEWNLLKELDLSSEKASTQAFLQKTQQDLQKPPTLEPNETLIDNEYQRIMSLKKAIESKMRALGVLEQKKGAKKGSGSQNLMDLKNAENIFQARESLRSYMSAVRQAARFLRDIEVSLLPPQGPAGLCSERLEGTQQALDLLQQQFQTHVEQLQSQVSLHPYLSPQKVEQLQENILSQLLVRMSTLQAKGHVQLEYVRRCAEHHRRYTMSQDEIIQSVKSAENSLLQVIRQKVTCINDCSDQHAKLTALSEEVESLQRRLEELKEWCPEQSCRGGREAIVAALWKWVSRLQRFMQELTTRSKQRIAEWSEIAKSVEKAAAVLEEVEAELPDASRVKGPTEELQDLLQSWEQYHDRLDCEHRALSALELRTARLLGVPAHLEQAPPTPLCQQLQAMQGRYGSVKQRSRGGLEAVRMELEEREKVRVELQGVRAWLEAADALLSEMEQSSSTQELQRTMEGLKMKYSDMYTLVPVEIEGQMQEVTQSLQQVEVKVGEAVERSGPVHRLGAKLSEIQAGLMSVQKRLEQRSPTVTQAKITQKRVWDELDVWHSCLASLEVAMQDLEKPEDALTLTERLVEVQQLHSQLAKQAEQRTTLISKIHTWLEEHQEMINSSKSWMTEAESWLAAPCTYTTAKCLSSHVVSLQTVLDDSAQIRTTLQGFSSVLKEMSQVCNVTTLQEQLMEADHQVSTVQDSFTAPLSQLEHAAAEVEAIESEVRRMENDAAEIKTLLTSPETFPSPREESLKVVEQRILSMRRTIAEIQKCKPGLCLPDKAEETLIVFTVVDQLQTLLLELEKKVPALFIQQPPTPVQAKAQTAQQTSSKPQLLKSTSEEAKKEDTEQGQIRIVHVEEDVLKRSGATLLTVEKSSPEQRQSWTPDSTEWERQGVLRPEGAGDKKGSEEQRVEEGGGGVLWWLWDAFLGVSPETEAVAGQITEQTGGDKQDVEGPSDTTGASSSEALSKPLATVRTQSLPESMAPEEPRPGEGVLHVCLERAGQLELWLQKAQRSMLNAAGSTSMQDSVEQQLLTCQEMFLEIEQRVACLSELGQAADHQHHRQDEGGAAGSEQEAAELLSSKLELLKANLVSFQQLLQDRQEEERSIAHRETQEQRSAPQPERRPESQLKRSNSVQEIFSSPRNKLLRQSSLQQQKELEQELTEQRGLTQAIARQGSRARLHSQDPEDCSQPSPWSPPAEADVEEDSAQKKWDRLHSRLLALEESWLLPPSEPSSDDGSCQTLDEGLFHVLYGASLSLSSINNLLHSSARTKHDEDPQLRLLQLQSLSAELATLGSELTSQGSKVSRVLGSECVQWCVDGVWRVLPVVQAALTNREKQLRNLQEERAKQQAVDQVQQSLQQQVEQVSSLLEEADQNNLPASFIHQATQMQGELDGALGALRPLCEELRSSVELQQQYERLVHSLKGLLALGSERLALQADAELHSRARLQQQHSGHTKFFQFLGHHWRILQYLTQRLPQSALQRWEGVVTSLQDEVARQQQQGLDRGSRMQETLQWEEDSAWSDSLLRRIETSFPKMHDGGDSEEQISEKLSVYQDLRGALEESEARFGRMLEAGLWLQTAGCRGVGVSIRELEARWRSLHKKVENKRTNIGKNRKLRIRFLRDSAALSDWMFGARELMDKWSRLSDQEEDAEQRRDDFFQFVALTKELEAKSELKVSVIGAGNQLVQLNEADRDSGRNPADKDPSPSESSDPDLCSVHSQLRKIELDWSSLLTDVPVVQQALHMRWMKTLTQQGALLELQAWLDDHRSKITQSSSSNSDLSQLLKYCKECQAEMSAHQASLDFVNQPFQTCSPDEGQRGRYEHNQFAEEQGRLNHQWLSLQETLNSQVQEVEQALRSRVEQEARLQHISSWIKDQDLWMVSAQTPSIHTELQRSIDTCKDLEEKIGQKSEALQELRNKAGGGGGENSSCGFVSQTDKCIQACAALTQQNQSVKQRLTEAEQLWDRVKKQLSQMMMKTARTSQTLDHHSSPQLCLQAHRELHEKLQLLHEERQASEAEWDELSRNYSSLREIISPAAAALFKEQLDRQRDSWTDVSAALDQKLQRSRGILQVWELYARLAASFSQRLQTLQSNTKSALSGTPADDNAVEQVAVKVQTLLERTDSLQSDLGGVLEASKDLVGHLEPSATGLVQSESRLLSRGVQQLSRTLTGNLAQLQHCVTCAFVSLPAAEVHREELERLQEFGDVLESLEGNLELWQERLQDEARTADQSGLLELSGLSADLDVLNELSCSLPLGDAVARRLQRLNRRWADASARAEEACSELQTEALRRQSFEQKCESWMSFLQRMEDSLAVDVAGSYVGLRQQLCTHKRFQAELSTGHQILHSVITEALHLLQKGEVEDRSDFILKLAQLREHWQGAVQRADQRRSLVEGLVKHWHLYSRSLRKLQRFLSDTQILLPPAGPARCSLMQLRRSLQDLQVIFNLSILRRPPQHTELLFQRYQCSFIHTLEVGRQLFSMGDEETQTQLQMDLGTLQEDWDNLYSLLGRRMEVTEDIVKNWERCEAGLADSMLQLKDVKTRLNRSMPDCDDDLQSAEKFNKEIEDSLEDWAESLTELSTMKTDVSQYIIADDVLLLQEQVEHLHCQWEELCLKVSLRKQEIADRLNAWIIFNEKNKELCEWLTQMENKVAHNSDLNIEEMVEKLKKDCMEEINLFSENKTHLKQLGEQLITASNKTKETEINDKLKDVNDRWQHLFDHIEARVRKLKETLVTVQQLDKNMSNLRTWLSRIEAELAKPVVYSVCHSEEIQRKLAEQQDLQRDIEQHTDSVASVLTLCDVLLHDADACGSDSENDSIQQTTRSLDRRWRNICAMSMERRMRIEETWRLWCKFLEDYSHFEDWLKAAELTMANPDSANVLYTNAKEELKKFEAFQRQVHERLTQLELVNKQYRRLARENRTDAASKLKVMVHEGNQRWDSLQRRVAAILRRLKHFTSQREDFEGTREGILVWLTEMDLQLTNVEHFSESDIEDKMRQLNGFQQEITLNTNKIDALIVFGENLIQKSAPLDAVLIEDELEELHSYCQEVFGRVARFHHRLVNRRPVLEEEKELSDRDTDLEDSPDLTDGTSWSEARKKGEEGVPAAGVVSAGRQAMCHLLAPPLERSGRETPVSVDSIPLEWDHTVDVGGSSSHEDDEDATFFSALSVKSVTDPPSWHQPGSPERKRIPREIIRGLSSSPTHATSTPFHQQGYAKLMSECSGSINSVKRVKLILNDEEELEDPGLTSSTADKQTSTGVIERWELLQVQKFSSDTDIKQDLEQWQKLNSDLCDVTSWLGRVLPELERLQRIAPSTRIRDIEVNIRKLKEMQRTFNSYKCLMISANLSSHHFLRGDSAELQEALSSANHSWTQACGGLESWERRLHSALMQCQEFHETLHSLLLWLAQAENKLCAVNVSDPSTPRSDLLQHRDTLTIHPEYFPICLKISDVLLFVKALQEELCGRQRQVSSLQEISSQLLLEATTEDSVEAKEKVHVICNKLRLLLRQVVTDLHTLQGRLETCSTSSEMDSIGLGMLGSPLLHKEEAGLQAATAGRPLTRREERRDSSPRRPLFYRVLRAAFPLHLLFFMLLVLACLVPLSEEDYSCTLSNNFARSFYPMLRYTNGPPPT
ncbi:hypothetical protein L3Q82_008148 [Scortum barcoo]|uniref:Uncharacterized protein n=1 Tax=Scortum barcoo TaxID=214431 RepID=A0ACB8WHQ3_9TELE|nr:hypothetical protein L3Q82_008148 [Scortum barcoo]